MPKPVTYSLLVADTVDCVMHYITCFVYILFLLAKNVH